MKRWQIVLLASLSTLCLIAASYLIYQKRSNPDTIDTPGTAQELSQTQVANHNTTDDCWIILNSKVFNVTRYIEQHPDSSVKDSCGKVFATTDKKITDAVSQYYIGLLTP